jgi:dTDP-4-dehydrorhamnose reductase
MRLLLIGREGQVATELRSQVPDGTNLTVLARPELDLTRPQDCAEAVDAAEADVIISAAADTAVDKAETEEEAAHLINAEAPTAMARAAAARGIPFLHVSTDYVYDGEGETPFHPDSATGPLSAYGRTKLAGDLGVIAAGGSHIVLRTSWVVSAHGSNFVKTMLRLGAERNKLTIVADQVGGPTAAGDIAAALLSMARSFAKGTAKSGVYHFSGSPDVSWADFAREIFRQAGITCEVEDIPTSDYPTPAQRPSNSRLDCSATEAVFGIPRPDWRASLADILKELGAT